MGGVGSLAMVSQVVSEDQVYFVGSCRRTRYDVAAWPCCLSANNGAAACLGGYDDDAGNLWQVVPDHSDQYVLMCTDVGASKYLGRDLKMKANREDAALWNVAKASAYRGGPCDTAVTFANNVGQILCSRDPTRQI